MNSPIQILQEQYPSPRQWGNLEIFEESLEIGTLCLKMVGLTLTESAFASATGSAAAIAKTPWERAYFELLERGYLLEAEKQALVSPNKSLTLQTADGSSISVIQPQILFNNSNPSNNNQWRMSKSNGVAIHTQLSTARENAAFELFERDRILRFWYSRRAPQLMLDLHPVIAPEIADLYDINAYLFAEPNDLKNGIFVVGVFGFPKNSKRPMLMGFGAANTLVKSLNKALNEIYQRLAFMWDESTHEDFPNFDPSPEFHLDYYQNPKTWTYLQDWLSGHLSPLSLEFSAPHWRDLNFVNLMELFPQPENSQLYLIKAVSDLNIPLTFGAGNPKVSTSIQGQFAIHPIS